MNEHRKSDSPVVPMKAPNNAGQPVAEEPEGRGLAKGNLLQQNAPRAQRRPRRHHLRQEPDAGNPLVRIR